MKAKNLLKRSVLACLVIVASAGVLQAQDRTRVDFTQAAEKTVDGVVHVKTKTIRKQAQGFAFPQDPFFEYFFGQPFGGPQPQIKQQPIMGSGSGVIISTDGYIVTNNHVVAEADEIEVVLNDKRSFDAKVIGKDPNTDIALIKIEADSLTAIPMGNSDNLKVGEWVLAIGNPFNLTSTVTAGIVSAKARDINIITSEMRIESFIQTDAAVNPGNSGGALVNINGELVGINTAIASQTGSYAGYSFAVPSSIVQKVVADIKQYGEVQRAVLGVTISDITKELATEKKLTTYSGVYVRSVAESSAAKAAGIKEGDIITQVDNVRVKSVSELQEQIARHSPGDKINIKALRDGKEKSFEIELKNKKGSTGTIKHFGMESLGASFEPLTDKQKTSLKIQSGVVVKEVAKNGKFAKAGIPTGFVIQKINNKAIKEKDDIENALRQVENSLDAESVLFISGVNASGKIEYYAVNLMD